MCTLLISLLNLSIPDVPFPVLLSTLIRIRFQAKPATFLIPIDFPFLFAVEELYGARYHSGSFSLIYVGSGFHCLRNFLFFSNTKQDVLTPAKTNYLYYICFTVQARATPVYHSSSSNSLHINIYIQEISGEAHTGTSKQPSSQDDLTAGGLLPPPPGSFGNKLLRLRDLLRTFSVGSSKGAPASTGLCVLAGVGALCKRVHLLLSCCS